MLEKHFKTKKFFGARKLHKYHSVDVGHPFPSVVPEPNPIDPHSFPPSSSPQAAP
jgi:hypothetical protein